MRKLAALSAAVLAAFLSVVPVQPAAAQQAGSLTGFATGTYSPGLQPVPTVGGESQVSISGEFAGLAGNAGGRSAGIQSCQFQGTTVGTMLIEQGNLQGSCFGWLLHVDNYSCNCTMQYTRVGIQTAVFMSCNYVAGEAVFTASGAGMFDWIPTSALPTSSFVLIGTGAGV